MNELNKRPGHSNVNNLRSKIRILQRNGLLQLLKQLEVEKSQRPNQ